MAQMCKVEFELEIKSNPDKFYGFLRNNFGGLAQIFPQHITALELLEGDAGSAGAVHLMKYVLGVEMGIKLKVEEVDDENKTISYRGLEGDFLKMYKSLKSKIEVKKNGNICLGKWTIEYEKAFEGAPNADAYAQFGAMISKGLDAYLVASTN